MATGNEYRKVRALLTKTVTAGCTEGEAVASLELGLKLAKQYGLDMSKLTITVPEGYTLKDGVLAKVEAEPEMAKPKRERKARAAVEAKPPRVKNGERLLSILRRPEGATIVQIQEAFGWLPHTARACISIEGRKAGVKVSYDRATKVYRAAAI